ncbi:SIS domain-containing protein [Sphingomonas sp. Tas61C01]|uniref:SIS domain-containing protein n=1 Tax=Sphingomonas sp. Tas61C01 TaxID=3458297 RepID=UPI00403EEB7A
MTDVPDAPAPEDTRMFVEAAEGGEAVARFLAHNRAAIASLGQVLRQRRPGLVVTCARGSSDHAATYAKYMIETRLGVPTSSAALSVASIFAAPVASEGCRSVCIAISQSGRSPDLLAAVAAHRAAGALTIALVNDEGSPLAAAVDVLLPLKAGPELSVAATKSYIVALAGIAALVAEWAEDADLAQAVQALPDQLERAFALDWSAALSLAEEDRSWFVLGRGHGYGIAQEAALKLKETCGIHAESFSAAEVRHGPMAIVGEGFPILAFATGDETGQGVRDVAAEFRRRGARVALADAAGGADALPAIATLPALEPILLVQSFYRYANALSLARGLDPDVPPHLNKVTSTK